MEKFTVVITGAASGIGHYIAKKYVASNNYSVICIDINNIDEIENSKKFNIDLKIDKDVEKIFNSIKKIDLAVNCAGVSGIRKKIIEFSRNEITSSWEDNFIPSFNALKNEIKIMKDNGGGKIINIASITGKIGMENFLAYSSAKASIINMTKVAAIECANHNIKVNSISPATIDTPMIRKKFNGSLKDYTDIYYTKNCGDVSDVYSIVKMLEFNNFMTGNDIILDGGLTNLFKI